MRTIRCRLQSRLLKSGVFPILMAVTCLGLPARAVKSEVFVLATLYKKHETVAVYDLASLRRIILAINPEVVVLDVNPDELKNRKVHPSKIEYPNVIFPILQRENYIAYAAEPAEPMFSDIVQPLANAFQQFKKNTPDEASAMEQYTTSLYDALNLSWRTPADVNSALTDKVLSGKQALQGNFVRLFKDSERRWNQHTTDVVLRAVKENPGKRVLVLIGIENCYWVRNALKSNSKVNLIDMERWLRTNSQTSLVANDVVTAAQARGTRVKVPYGTAAVIDGRIAGTEWKGSALQQLSDGTTIRLHHDGENLFVGITAARRGFASVCVAQTNAVKVFHASAALGSVSYTMSGQDYVTNETAFEYGMRYPDLTEAARAERSDYMSHHGWVASTFSMGAGVVQEIQLSLTRNSGITGLAIAFFVPSGETGTVITWPETLAKHDGCRNERLVRGYVPPRLRFEPRRWAALTLEPR